MNPSMNRRTWLGSSALLLMSTAGLLCAPAAAAAAAPRSGVERLAAGWRLPKAEAGETADRVGILAIDWDAGQVELLSDLPAPGRAHGLLGLADGGFLAVATRPGRWLLHCDAQGREVRRLQLDAQPSARTLNGHVEPSADGHWLYSTETDPRDGSSWLGVREAATLRRVAEWRLPGLDAHQMLLDEQGQLMIALGGIPRNEAGRKVQLDQMASSLIRFDPQSGQVTGQWRLPDPRLSLRHLAWSEGQEGTALLGIGLQAEHDEPARRQRAPALALWDGRQLSTPSHDAQAAGYAGDVVAGPGGGFMITSDKSDRGLWWHPDEPRRMTTVAQLAGIYALASGSQGPHEGTRFASQTGVSRWHPREAPRLLLWPRPMAVDNHWIVLA